MSTSLAEQLKRLTVPQTSLLEPSKKRATLLFNPKEAANLDRSAFYEIGRCGFEDLKKLNKRFEVYKHTLFSESSKDFERSIQSADINNKLNKNIKNFILLLSPYFLLKPAHQALEWLIYRFHIHQYNQKELFMLILPYHETNIFVRCLQILDLGDSSNKWYWLHNLQRSGVILPKSAIINHCASDVSFLQFIGDTIIEVTKLNESSSKNLTAHYAFYCTTVIGSLEISNKISEQQISQLLPALLKGLSSKSIDFTASSYMIIAKLIQKTKLTNKLLFKIISKLICVPHEMLQNEAILLLVIIYQSHSSLLKEVPADIIDNIINKNWFVGTLANIANSGAYISPFLIPLFAAIFKLLFNDNSEEQCKLADSILTEIKLENRDARLLIITTLDCYVINENKCTDEDLESKRIDAKKWYSKFLKRLETQHSEVFNQVVTEISKEETRRKRSLMILLNFVPSLSYMQENFNIFEYIYHPNDAMRIAAVQGILKHYVNLQDKDKEIFKAPLLERLKDDQPRVVKIVLSFPTEYLIELFGQDVLLNTLLDLLTKSYLKQKYWKRIVISIIDILCSVSSYIDNTRVLVALFPLLFNSDADKYGFIKHILNSNFIKENYIFKLSKLHHNKKNINIPEIQASLFECIKFMSQLNEREKLVNELLAIVDNNLDNVKKYTLLLLLTFCIPLKCNTRESYKIINKIFKLVSESKMDYLKDSNVKSLTHLQIKADFQMICKGSFPLQTFLYCINNVISKTNVEKLHSILDFTKENTDVNFVVFMFKTLMNGCDIRNNDSVLLYTKVMKVFFATYFFTVKQKIDFLCNFIYAHELKQNELNPITFVSLNLQLKCIKIIHAFLQEKKTNYDWLLKSQSNIIIPSILNSLLCPTPQIRQASIQLLHTIKNITQARYSDLEYAYLVDCILEKENEILLDHEQLPLLMYSYFSPDKSVRKTIKNKRLKVIMNRTLQDLFSNCNKNYPLYYVSMVLKSLSLISTTNVLNYLSVTLNDIIEGCNRCNIYILDDHQSSIFVNVLSKLNNDIIAHLTSDCNLWKLITLILKQHKLYLLSEDDNYVNCSVYLLNTCYKFLYEQLSDDLKKQILSLIVSLGTESDNSDVISAIMKFMKQINLDVNHIMDIIYSMRDAKGSPSNSTAKKRTRRSNIPSIDTLNTVEWERGVTLLEYIQNKKKMSNIDVLLPALFDILRKCLQFMEQAALEYTKQLILSCILNCCQKLPDEKSLPPSIYDVEMVVQCIRNTQNPQTHHHALFLLTYMAKIIPDQVLHHIMAIFTFIGSSVLRRDDAYSFQIIEKIIDSVIPVLVKCDELSEDMSDKTAEQMMKNVVPVVRVFVDIMLDIPIHRRLPLLIKLINRLGSKQFLWVFLILVIECQVRHSNEKVKTVKNLKTLADVETPLQRLEIIQSLAYEFSPSVILHNCIKIFDYINNLPVSKYVYVKRNNEEYFLFNIEKNTPKQFRHFKYLILTFLSGLLSHQHFIMKVAKLHENETEELEPLYKTMIIKNLGYIQVVSRISEKQHNTTEVKYWKVMLHHCYDILDCVNSLLSADMFLLVIKGLMAHNVSIVRRKAMELLNTRLQNSDDFFKSIDSEKLLNLIPPLMNVVNTIKEKDQSVEAEEQTNQQTALISIKLLSKIFAHEQPEKFKNILVSVIDFAKSTKGEGNVQASLILCIAELCNNLRVHSLYSLNSFMPVLLKILKSQKYKESPDLMTFSIITAISKVVETLPLFLNPYLDKLLFEISVLSCLWTEDSTNIKLAPIMQKLKHTREKLTTSVPPRVIVPSIEQTFAQLLNKTYYSAIGTLMETLAQCIKTVQGTELKSVIQELTNFFLSSLQLRSDLSDEISDEDISQIEEYVITALIALVLKMSESSFRPFYYRLFDWASRNAPQKERSITFYRVSYGIATNLKSLFVLFAGHFLNNAAQLLDECNNTKHKTLVFESEEKCVLLIENILQTLNCVFSYDSQNFINKERFQILMQPLVDQLENTVAGLSALRNRAQSILIPCIAQFAVATADDALWKQLNYQILLKTRHNSPEIRLTGLDCLNEITNKIGEDFLPLLPETIPFLAELLEDEDESIEAACRKVVQQMEKVLGEPLQKYF